MKDETKQRWMRYFTMSIIAVIIIVGLVIAYPEYRRGESLKLQEAELRARIEAKKHEIAQLKECQKRFRTDPEFVESIARQNRRVFPGELVFIFED